VGVLARHAWQAGEQLDLHADVPRSAQAIGEFAGAQAARGYLEFCARAAYRAHERPFMRARAPGSLATGQG
jgi:1-hydroxycarotenoid 3,4-desaturase